MSYKTAYWQLTDDLVALIDLLERVDEQQERVETATVLRQLIYKQEQQRRAAARERDVR